MGLTEAMIHQIADPEVFARGRDYLRQGAVSGLTRRGDQVTAEVEGSDIEPYRVSVKLSASGIEDTSCTCPYDWGGACKHIVAVLLACLEQATPLQEAVPLETQLAGLDAGQMRSLLLGLAGDDPDLAARIDRRVVALRTLPAPGAPPPPPDAAAIRREVRSALRESGRRGYYDDYGGGAGEVVAEVQAFLTPAEALIEAGHGRNAIVILEAVTEEFLKGWDEIRDYDDDGECSSLLADLGSLWTEAILTADLTAGERKSLAKRLGEWQKEVVDYLDEGGFAAAAIAAEQGWDYPPLLLVLQGEITKQGAWEADAPDCADELAIARLNILERQGRLQEYLYLAEAEGQTELHLTMLVRLRRVREAVEAGRASLATPGQALVLAKALHEHGDPEEALSMAEFGLNLQPLSGVRGGQAAAPEAEEDALEEDEEDYALGEDEEDYDVDQDADEENDEESRVGHRAEASASPRLVDSYAWTSQRAELARWLRDTATALGQPARALPAARTVMEVNPSLADYQALQAVAGEEWPAIRAEILGRLRQSQSFYREPEIDIFLAEGLIDDAIAALERGHLGHVLVERVVDAAMLSRPEWAMKACYHQADRIIEPGSAQYYYAAAEWLRKARKAAVAAGREDVWRAHMSGIMTKHGRKYKLMGLLKPLV
jgi:uncharacterized Zn finger protein